jgi:hypothetical protein
MSDPKSSIDSVDKAETQEIYRTEGQKVILSKAAFLRLLFFSLHYFADYRKISLDIIL